MNRAMIIGYLGRDPETRYTQSGKCVVNFSVATSERWTDRESNEKRERTEWHRCVAFGKLAEICEKFLCKGKQVYCEGKIRTEEYDDKDGNKRWSTKIYVESVEFLGGGRQNDGDGGEQTQSRPRGRQQQAPDPYDAGSGGAYAPPGPEDDDIPF